MDTPIVNALVGLLQILVTGVGPIIMQRVGFMMFNFIAPWLPLIAAVAFVFGVISWKRSPENIWVLAIQMNIPGLFIGIWKPFFWVAIFLTVPVTAAGVAFGRKLFQQGSSA